MCGMPKCFWRRFWLCGRLTTEGFARIIRGSSEVSPGMDVHVFQDCAALALWRQELALKAVAASARLGRDLRACATTEGTR